MFINIEDKMPDKKNDKNFNAQRGVTTNQDFHATKGWNEVDAEATKSFIAQSGNLDSTQGNNMDAHGSVSSNSSLVWDNNGDTVRLVAGSTNNFANRGHFGATWSNEPFGDAVASERDETASIASSDWEFEPARRNNGNAQRSFSSSPILGDNNGTVGSEAGFTNNFKNTQDVKDWFASNEWWNNNVPEVVRKDEGYNSDPDSSDNLDNGSKADDKQSRLAQIRQEGAKLFGIAGKSFSKLSARDQVLVGAAIGALVTIALPALLFAVAVIAAGGIIAAAGALIGAVVGVVLYAGIKTVQGINWAAQETIEGAKSTARKITSGVSRTVANVGAKIQYSATETDYQEKLRRITDAQNESYDEVKRVYNQEVEGVSDDVGLSEKEKHDITEAILNSIVSKLNSEIEGVKRNKQEAESAEEVKDAEALLDQLTQKRDFFAGLDVKSARKLFSGQQTAISNKDRYSFVTVLAGNSDKIIGVISMEVQKAYDEKSKLANNASNAAGKPKPTAVVNPLDESAQDKPKRSRWFNRKPEDGTSHPKSKSKFFGLFNRKSKAVEGGGSTNTSTTTLASESSPGKGARVHFADVPGGTQRRHSHDGATLSSRILSDDNSSTLRRANSVNDLMQSNVNDDLSPLCGAHSVSDNLANGSSGAPSPVAGSPVHGDNLRGDEINQMRLRKTGKLEELVNGKKQGPKTALNGVSHYSGQGTLQAFPV